jgi:hypothetical protein
LTKEINPIFRVTRVQDAIGLSKGNYRRSGYKQTVPRFCVHALYLLPAEDTSHPSMNSGLLSTSSAQQSGLKVQVHSELKDGITYKIILDFDAARSIVATGSSKYNLKPVIRAITIAQTGAIEGAVSPAIALPVVYAINGADTVSTYANTSGSFLVRGLAPATYRLVLVSKSGATIEKTAVAVTTGNVTDVGTITF